MYTVPRILSPTQQQYPQDGLAGAERCRVEVVAVGNGEAAVRKIAEIKPDLVLADIFMPVRSGYEVCEFVKRDPRFAHTPVVLLIGVFDPFDEREAQRVQADGILKKPFVPPDSLLRMVADLLAKSAVRMAPVAVAAGVAKADRAGIAGTAASAPETDPAGFMDAAPEEFEPAKARLEWNAAEQPVAFSTLLESPFAETEESVVTAQRDPTLGEPAFWTEAAQPGEAPVEQLAEEESWGASPNFDPLADESARPAEIAEIETPVPAPARLETTPELPELAASLNRTAGLPGEVPAAPSPLLSALPPLHLSLPEFPEDAALAPPSEILPAIPGFEARASEAESKSDPVPDLKDFAWAMPSYVSGGPDQEIAPKSKSQLIEPAPPALATLAPLSSAPGMELSAELEFETTLPAFQAASQANATVPDSAAHLGGDSSTRLDPAAIEGVVLRVIERMQPKIIELVTRELLRPVVEALVQRELEKK
jgi:CheY-like chemotaxis protein